MRKGVIEEGWEEGRVREGVMEGGREEREREIERFRSVVI